MLTCITWHASRVARFIALATTSSSCAGHTMSHMPDTRDRPDDQDQCGNPRMCQILRHVPVVVNVTGHSLLCRPRCATSSLLLILLLA